MLPIKVYQDKECHDCVFQEYEGYECWIPELSGYNSEDDRIYTNEKGQECYKPCKFRIEWDHAQNIITWFLQNQSHEVISIEP